MVNKDTVGRGLYAPGLTNAGLKKTDVIGEMVLWAAGQKRLIYFFANRKERQKAMVRFMVIAKAVTDAPPGTVYIQILLTN